MYSIVISVYLVENLISLFKNLDLFVNVKIIVFSNVPLISVYSWIVIVIIQFISLLFKKKYTKHLLIYVISFK